MKIKSILCATFTAAMAVSASAMSIGIDQIISDEPGGMSGSLDISFLDATTIQILLTNTSTGTPSEDSLFLLTGLGMDFGSVLVTGGDAFIHLGSTGDIGGLYPEGTSVKGEWGYTNGVSGHFNDLATGTTTTQISSMAADAANAFGTLPTDSLDNPDNTLNGPESGLLSKTATTGSLNYIQDTLRVTLTLDTAFGDATAQDAFLTSIDAGHVAITFGSPTGGEHVPDGGTTAMLFGLGLLGLAGSKKLRR